MAVLDENLLSLQDLSRTSDVDQLFSGRLVVSLYIIITGEPLLHKSKPPLNGTET